MTPEHAREAWLCLLSGKSLPKKEEAELLQSLALNGELRDQLLEDAELDGSLQAWGRARMHEVSFTRSLFYRIAAADENTRFFRKLEARLGAGLPGDLSPGEASGGRAPVGGKGAQPPWAPRYTLQSFPRNTSQGRRTSHELAALAGVAIALALSALVVLGPSDPGPETSPRMKESRGPAMKESELRSDPGRKPSNLDSESPAHRADGTPSVNPGRRPRLSPPEAEPRDDPADRERQGKALAVFEGGKEPVGPDPPVTTDPIPPPPTGPTREEERPSSQEPRGAGEEGGTRVAIARVEGVTGEAHLVIKEETFPVKPGSDLLGGQGLEMAGATSRLVLRLPDETRIELGPETLLQEIRSDPGIRILLMKGSLQARVNKQPKSRPLVIVTPQGEAKVLGTTLRIDVDPDPSKGTRLNVDEGKVELRNLAGKTVLVDGGHYAQIAPGVEFAAKPLAFWEGALAVYLFNEGRGKTVHDGSRKGSALDLHIENESSVRWQPKGLTIVSPTLIASVHSARKIIDACKASNELSVEVWFRPATVTPGTKDLRILTLSADPGNQNVMMGQDELFGPPASYFVRFRTTANNAVGKPAVASPEGSATGNLTHLVYTRGKSGRAAMYLDGREVSSDTVPGSLSSWNDGYHLGLGNEFTHDRPWLGEYRFAAIYGRALSADDIKEHYRAGVE
jgi:hypothetical protein